MGLFFFDKTLNGLSALLSPNASKITVPGRKKKRIHRTYHCLAKSVLVTGEPRGENHEVDSGRGQFLCCLGVVEGAHGSV